MKTYIYLSLIPEGLVASHLSPFEFGNYLAVGTKKRSRGQAIFFEIERFDSDFFQWDEIEQHCVPHSDGRAKRSAYLGIYRVLEHVPLDALKSLYLVTDDGRVLELKASEFQPANFQQHHLYQELCPVTPRVVSVLDPSEFCKSITDRSKAVSVNKMAFCELTLNKLSRDPDSDDIGDLPYPNIGHLRDCLRELEDKSGKNNKQVDRGLNSEILYRTVKNGFFVGDCEGMKYYPMPSQEQLEREYYTWWRSALTTFGQ